MKRTTNYSPPTPTSSTSTRDAATVDGWQPDDTAQSPAEVVRDLSAGPPPSDQSGEAPLSFFARRFLAVLGERDAAVAEVARLQAVLDAASGRVRAALAETDDEFAWPVGMTPGDVRPSP